MYFDDLVSAYDKSRSERNAFHDLMQYRMREVLLVASLYEAFVLESDGVLTEQIYGEYFKLHLNTIPRITCAYSAASALDLFSGGHYDLVVLVSGLDFEQPLALAVQMKKAWPGIPILLMATNNASLAALEEGVEAGCGIEAIDRVFVWNGYSKLFVGMLKQIEDLRNVEADTRTGLVRVILLIEDSVRYYSRYLPLLFQVVQRQAQILIENEKGVETSKLLQARSRPKILLASSYEEAKELFDRYEPYMLTVITDVRFPRQGRQDPEAGFDFIKMVRSRCPDLPLMIQSSEDSVRSRAIGLGLAFADKNSESLEHELASFLHESLGYGPFMFCMPDGAPVAEAKNLDEFLGLLEEVPEDCLCHHASKDQFSTWLAARGESHFARLLKPYKLEDFPSISAMRDFILEVVREARAEKTRGIVPDYDASTPREDRAMTRLASGSVGGKGRGLIFLRGLVENVDFARYVPGIDVRLPRTTFIGIDEFELFLESNGLWTYAFYESAASADNGDRDRELKARFLSTGLSDTLTRRLGRFAASTDKPLAVRSSGLFEDMLQVPFAGIYETYLLPNCHPDPAERGRQLCQAVLLVYASLFVRKTRDYFDMAGYALEEERMGVIIQEVVGSRHGNWYYPHISGTAQSRNYYPVSYLSSADGLCISALGLGSYVVGGGAAFRFCPKYPKLDIVPPERLRDSSQRSFLALDLGDPKPDILLGDEASLHSLDLSEAETDPRFPLLASTWNLADDRLVPGIGCKGPRVIDFANILKNEALPFAEAIAMVLDMGEKSMGSGIEIEYALNLDEASGLPALYLLQLKPLLRSEGRTSVDIDRLGKDDCFIYSETAMGNGRDSGIEDILWVDPRSFDRSATLEIAAEIEELNHEMRRAGRKYVLVGPGRWGTRDRWLGIPVAFTQISMARLIVEADLPDLKTESSQGSHFFHNVTSMNIGYVSVDWGTQSFVDWEWLYALPLERRSSHCVHTRLPGKLEILMDGRRGRAAVRKYRVQSQD